MKKPTPCLCLLALAVLSLLSGCASIFDGGRTKTVNIQSVPSGATIKVVDNRTGQTVYNGTTPASVALVRSSGYFRCESYTVIFKMDGYSDQTLNIQGRIDGWYFGNLVIGGLIGMVIVDPLTGAMYTFSKDTTANLIKLPGNALLEGAKEGDLIVASLSSIPEELRGMLVPVK